MVRRPIGAPITHYGESPFIKEVITPPHLHQKKYNSDLVLTASPLAPYDASNASPVLQQIANADRLLLEVFERDGRHAQVLSQLRPVVTSTPEFTASTMFSIVGKHIHRST